MSFSEIIAYGHYLPETLLKNEDLKKFVDTSDEWIFSRTGIRQRHIAEKKELASHLAIKASEDALNSFNINPQEIDCIITTGGTGLTGRDTTPEAVMEIADKTIEGFGELFRQISFSKIGTSAIQSRALAALINTTYVFCLPGSKGACKDGWDEILQYQLDIRHRPCNFVEIMPRLSEK